jgi:peptidoglycan-N-acetylglucosamine deacetylase
LFVAEQKSLFLQYLNIDSVDLLPASYAPWTLTMDYETTNHSDDVISIVYTISEYTGGAHPNSYFRTFTFNLTENELIEFDDLFIEGASPLETIAPLVQADLTEQMGEFADAEWIERGTGEDPLNYQNFALTEDELIFYFPPYQVAAYAAGTFEVRIPLSDLSGILAQM